MQEIVMIDLLKAGAHFGHRTKFWNPKMAPYIFGARNKIHIINLEHTLPAVRQAQDFIRNLAKNRNKLLFVGTKRSAKGHIAAAAIRTGQPYVNQRWLGGMLTNYKTIRASIKRYQDIEHWFEDGRVEKLTKKERLNLDNEKAKLEKSIGGIKEMGGLPDALFIVDIDHEHIAVKEARNLGIPIVAIVDTNSDPDGIDYVIPGNDDAGRSIELFVSAIADAYATGHAESNEMHPVAKKHEPQISSARQKTIDTARTKEVERAVKQPVVAPAATADVVIAAAAPVAVVESAVDATPPPTEGKA